ncbi:diguanylate cyclase [Propionivibrio limicola]|uniref:diguanylate cyclase n=1 Tax=Propionivibrio limicola TaxID=167645 RepID=UPI001290DDA6|nr:diguanylate cyclase [Propionivibrio limicola]
MIPHIPTMLLMIIAASATLALSVGWVARRDEKEGLQLWTAALSLHAAVFILFALRGKIPDFLSILVSNVGLSGSYALLLAAIAQFQQRKLSPLVLWGPPLLIGTMFSFLMSDIAARIVMGGIVFTAQIAMILLALTSRNHVLTGRGKHLMVGGALLMIATLVLRIVTTAFGTEDIASIMRETPVQTATFLVAFVSLILVSNGFVLMTKERADERIRLLAKKDRLTGLWNRIRLEEAGQTEMARLERYGHPVSLIMIDLDHFKGINDRFGHATGDLILKGFAGIAENCIRTTDVLGRWGGEEFLIILPHSGLSSTAQLAERIRGSLEQHIFPGGHKITASFGVAVCQSTDTWDSWLGRADSALYQAKAAGRNRVETELLEPGAEAADPANTGLIQLVWHPSYESGNELIDAQHRALVEQANQLMKAILGNQSKAAISQSIGTLLAEIGQHFRDEEALFATTAYPEAAYHRELHDRLTARALDLAEQFNSDRLGVGELLHYLAYEVVAQHMLIEDRKYFPWLAAASVDA